MSMLLHVHRASEWFDSELLPIDRWEWDAYAALADDLEIQEDGLVLWSADGADPLELEWLDGRIVAENRDAAARRRMAEIATALAGVLQGDDCELYGEDGEELDEDAANAIELPDPPTRSTADADLHPSEQTPEDRLWDPNRASSRADFLRSFLRRD